MPAEFLNFGIMEKKMETIGIIGFILGFIWGLYWGNIGIMEKKMETAIMLGFPRRCLLEVSSYKFYRDNGDENGNY